MLQVNTVCAVEFKNQIPISSLQNIILYLELLRKAAADMDASLDQNFNFL